MLDHSLHEVGWVSTFTIYVGCELNFSELLLNLMGNYYNPNSQACRPRGHSKTYNPNTQHIGTFF